MFDFKKYLYKALSVAKTRNGFCAPNPTVGAVLIKEGKIIATGVHWKSGYPHAEVEVIYLAGDDARGADLYLTLEPCCHYGKTPPCTELIIQSGIERVIYAHTDPNPKVSGRGQVALETAGVLCLHVMIPEVEYFYRAYDYWTRLHRPWVQVKLALSADLKIAGAESHPISITGSESFDLTHKSRLCADGILTSVKTILNDDPKFNVRLSHGMIAKPLFILDSHLRLETDSQIFRTSKSITVFYDGKRPKRDDFDCIAVPSIEEGLDLSLVLNEIGRRGVHTLWVEAGTRVFHSLCQLRLANEIILYRSPKIIGDKGVLGPKIDLKNLNWHPAGKDEVVYLTQDELADRLRL